MSLPKTYGPGEIPPSVRSLLSEVLPRLIEGPHPALAVLREQLRVAAIARVELTGVGFFVDFEVPSNQPLTDPLSFKGGSADISLTGVRHGAGCILFVNDGRLSMFEGYTHNDPWPEDAELVEVTSVEPIDPARSWEPMTVISELKSRLARYPQAKISETQTSIVIEPQDDTGFMVALSAHESGFTVSFDGWHEEFTVAKDALNCAAFGLSPACRLRVDYRGSTPTKWTVEAQRDGRWVPDSETGLFLVPFWRPRRVAYLQNHLL